MLALKVGQGGAHTVAVVKTVRTPGLVGVPGGGRMGRMRGCQGEEDFYLNVSVWVARMLVIRTGQALMTSLPFSLSLLLSSKHSQG